MLKSLIHYMGILVVVAFILGGYSAYRTHEAQKGLQRATRQLETLSQQLAAARARNAALQEHLNVYKTQMTAVDTDIDQLLSQWRHSLETERRMLTP